MPRWPVRTLRERLEEKILRIRLPNEAIDYTACHLWSGSHSQSGYRGVFYPILRGNKYHGWPVLRVNRLVLILEYGPVEVPPEPDESFDTWFARALKHYAGLEASHTCDNSMCVNFTHLEWKGHADNVATQVARRRARLLNPSTADSPPYVPAP